MLAHRDTLRAAIGRDPGLRVAILDYFVNVSHELRNPKVIELAIYERTERSAVTDGLTGLYNHSFFLQALRQEVLRSKRHGLRAALLLLDLDNFKQVNDERGHVEGDRVLMRAAAVVREGVREIDVAARYGGEEFAVLLPDTSRLGAFVVAERIRRRIEERFARGALARHGLGRDRGLPRRRRDPCRPDRAGRRRPLRRQGRGQEPHPAAAGREAPLPAPDLAAGRHGRRRAPAARRARVKNVSEGGLLVSLREAVPLGSAVSLTIERMGVDARGPARPGGAGRARAGRDRARLRRRASASSTRATPRRCSRPPDGAAPAPPTAVPPRGRSWAAR